MRVAPGAATRRVDLPLVQAARLRAPEVLAALQAGSFDPFPDGTVTTDFADEGAVFAPSSGVSDTSVAGGALSSFDSALPDHIQQALLDGLHNDDDGMQAFFALFDRRLKQLEVQARRAAILVATQDHKGREAASILTHLSRLAKANQSDPRYVQLLSPLLSRARTLEGLRDLVSWLSGRPVSVTANFEGRLPIDRDCRTRLRGKPKASVGLGQGTLLGKSGQTPMGRLSVNISCEDCADLDALARDDSLLAELQSTIAQYMRDPVPVTLFADVCRCHLDAPRLSTQAGSARLGTYSILQPERRPAARSAIKLAGIL